MSVVVLRSDLTANELLHDLEGVFPLGPREESTEVRTYQDTFDWRLHRSGFILSNFPSGNQVRLALEDAEGRQLENLKKVKAERDDAKVQACLQKIENAARDDKANLIPFFIEAVKEYTTAGEICGVLRSVFGEVH